MQRTKVHTSCMADIPFGRRNRLHNGDFRVDQINAGTLVTPTPGAYVMDNLVLSMSQASKISSQKVAGFISTSPYCAKASVVSAYTPVTSDYFGYSMFVEGLDTSDLLWGTENAKPITVSATVKVSVAGTYSFAVKNGTSTRSYVFTKTLVVGENKIIETIPGDVGGTLAIGNTRGLELRFDFGCGPTYQTSTAKTWVAGNYVALSGATRLVTNASSTYAIGTVQIEAGSVATPFEFLPYQQALAWCQRYYYISAPVGCGCNNGGISGCAHPTSNFRYGERFPVSPMRIDPVVTVYDAAGTAGKVSYYTTTWINGGVLSVVLTSTKYGIFVGHNISGAVETQFTYIADARMWP